MARYSVEDQRVSSSQPEMSPLNRPRSDYDSQSPSETRPSTPTTPPTPLTMEPNRYKNKWTGVLREFPYVNSIRSFGNRSGTSTPAQSPSPTFEGEDMFAHKFTEEGRGREKKRKRKKAEVFVSRSLFKRELEIKACLEDYSSHRQNYSTARIYLEVCSRHDDVWRTVTPSSVTD